MDWVSSVGWSATDFWVPEIMSCGPAGLGAGVAGHVLFFCVYRILLTVAGQMRSCVSTTSDADQGVIFGP